MVCGSELNTNDPMAAANQLHPRKQSRAVKAKPPMIPLDQPGRLRMANLMAIFNCSHTTIYQRIKTGEFPRPDGYDWPSRAVGKQGRPYWNTETIRARLAE